MSSSPCLTRDVSSASRAGSDIVKLLNSRTPGIDPESKEGKVGACMRPRKRILGLLMWDPFFWQIVQKA